MLDTSELELLFSMACRRWQENQEELQDSHGGLLCDFCGEPSKDGNLYNVPGGEEGCELLICDSCFLRVYGQVYGYNATIREIM